MTGPLVRPLLRGGIEIGEFGGRTGLEQTMPQSAPTTVQPAPQAGQATLPRISPKIEPAFVPKLEPGVNKSSPTSSEKDKNENNHRILYIQNNYDEGTSESNELHEFVGRWNAEITKNGGAMTTQSVNVFTRTAADRAASRERSRVPALYDGKAVGHIPDVVAGGNPGGPFMPLTKQVNSSIGAQVSWYHRRSKNSGLIGYTYNEVRVLPKPPPPPRKHQSGTTDKDKYASN